MPSTMCPRLAVLCSRVRKETWRPDRRLGGPDGPKKMTIGRVIRLIGLLARTPKIIYTGFAGAENISRI